MDWNEEAKRLLPCAWVIVGGKDEPQNECPPKLPGCRPCASRPAFAAALAAAEAQGAGTDKTKLMGELYGARSACNMLHSEISRLKAEVEDLKFDTQRLHDEMTTEYKKAYLDAGLELAHDFADENAQLRAERDEFKKSNAMWFEESKKAYAQKHEVLAERDAAVVQGMEMAKAVVLDWYSADAIQVEIDKRKGAHGNQR